jgi:hypothetical protein
VSIGKGFNLKLPFSSVLVKSTKVESISLIAIITALGKGPFTVVSCTFPETLNFCEKEEIVLNSKK